MNYKAAYYHLFNGITRIIILLENLESGREQVYVPALLKQLQIDSEDVCISPHAPPTTHRIAPRHGKTIE